MLIPCYSATYETWAIRPPLFSSIYARKKYPLLTKLVNASVKDLKHMTNGIFQSLKDFLLAS